MLRKVQMTCWLKNGHKIKETMRMSAGEIYHLEKLRIDLEYSLGMEPVTTKHAKTFTFGGVTVNVQEIAAIKFKGKI